MLTSADLSKTLKQLEESSLMESMFMKILAEETMAKRRKCLPKLKRAKEEGKIA